jgi:hypothetical protein
MREFNAIRAIVLTNPRPLTRDEYRIVKTVDWYNQKKFLINHLTQAGFKMYNESVSEGQNGKWLAYLRVWEIINTPLFKAMNE